MKVLVLGVILGCLVCIHGSPKFAQPLQVEYLALNPASSEDEGLNSQRAPPPPHTHVDNVVWDPSTMPLPDPNATMSSGPDRTFIPRISYEEEKEAGPVHTNKRNMVVQGTDMYNINKDPDLRSSNLPDIGMKSNGDAEMPLSPSVSDTEGCTDERSVLRVGSTPEFSKSLVKPTRDAKGTGPEVNSYKDFISGMITPRFVPQKTSTPKVVVAAPKAADAGLNPPTIQSPSEDAVIMAYKFIGVVQFLSGSDFSENFETRFGRIFREGIALGAKVPVGNVEITEVRKGNNITFEIGAPSLAEVRNEVTQLKKFVEDGNFVLSLRMRGFPQATVGSLTLGDGVEGISMPEATLSDQMGPPGGKEDEVLTPSEMRERVRAREAMTYGDYSRPGRVNLTNLSPHMFGDVDTGSASAVGTYYVVGRIKFFMADEDGRFAALYSPIVQRALANIADLSTGAVTISVNGLQQSVLMKRFHSLLQTETASTGLDAYVLVDFELSTSDLEAARRVQSAVVSSMSDILSGFRFRLVSTQAFPKDVDFTLLFIEIHGPNGMLVDECNDDEEADEDDDEKTLEGHIGRLASQGSKGIVRVGNVTVVDGHITQSSMAKVQDCVDKGGVQVTPDRSVVPEAPIHNSNDSWTAMSAPATASVQMNLPGRDGRSAPEPISAVHVSSAAVAPAHARRGRLLSEEVLLSSGVKPSPRERQFIDGGSEIPEPMRSRFDILETTQLSQLELRLKAVESMKATALREIAEAEATGLYQVDEKSSDMPEATDMTAPAGGYPVPDLDDGASM